MTKVCRAHGEIAWPKQATACPYCHAPLEAFATLLEAALELGPSTGVPPVSAKHGQAEFPASLFPQ
jgi:hypothetical protein